MKLRLRSTQTKETIKIETPNDSTLQQLKETLSLSHSPSIDASSIRLSLNRNDELHPPSPHHTSLVSLGITSGDLIYFSLHHSPTTTNNSNHVSSVRGMLRENKENPDRELLEHGVQGQVSGLSVPEQCRDEDPSRELLKEGFGTQGSVLFVAGQSSYGGEYFVVRNNEMGESERNEVAEDVLNDMEIDPAVFASMEVEVKRLSEPRFLRRVLREEWDVAGVDSSLSDHKMLVIAVHAVMLESGFVGFDSISGLRIDQFDVPEECPSLVSTVLPHYTTPELLGTEKGVESVILKFQSLGKFVTVYGSLKSGDSGVHRVCLNVEKFSPILRSVRDRSDKNDRIHAGSGSSSFFPECEVFEFWKIVKDRLALPLLIDLCVRTDMPLPACLIRLPTELKVKILELLPGVDLAKIACVCSEMRYLSSNNDLWKQKFEEEFEGMSKTQTTNWKGMFGHLWECRKKRKREMTHYGQMGSRDGRRFVYPFIRRDPYPARPFHIIGGEHDLFPGHGIISPPPFGQSGRSFPWFQMRH